MLNFRPDPRFTSLATIIPDSVIGTLVAAFGTDPAARRLYVVDEDYRANFPGFLRAFGGPAFDYGSIDAVPEAAALWFPPGVDPDDEAIRAHVEATIPAGRLATLARGMQLQAGLRPHAPHWYLPWLGVRPEVQRRGLGSMLLRRGLERADRDGLPAYLEATSRRNAALFARQGFEVTSILTLPDYPEIITMWRPARRQRAARPAA